MKRIPLKPTTGRDGRVTWKGSTSIGTSSGDKWALVVAQPAPGVSSAHVMVSLRRVAQRGSRTAKSAVHSRAISRSSLIPVRCPGARGGLELSVESISPGIRVEALLVDIEKPEGVEVRPEDLGIEIEHLVEINEGISQTILSFLDSILTDIDRFKELAESQALSKIYICGLGKKNKTADPCTVVNVVICGKKKDKKISEPWNVDGYLDMATVYEVIPYLEFLGDGGVLSNPAEMPAIQEFNDLGAIMRTVAVTGHGLASR